MQVKSKIKSSSNEKYITFNNAVKNDILEALKYAKDEIELKNILNTFGYENISFKNQNIQGKRKKTGLKFDYNEKSYTVYFNQIDLDDSTILFHLQNNSKNKIFLLFLFLYLLFNDSILLYTVPLYL